MAKSRNSTDLQADDRSGGNASQHLYPPVKPEVERETGRLRSTGASDVLHVGNLYDRDDYIQGEEPYDGYQPGITPPLTAPLATVRGHSLLMAGGIYYLIISLVFLVGGIYTLMGGTVVNTFLSRRGFNMESGFVSWAAPVIMLLLAAAYFVAGFLAVQWRLRRRFSIMILLLGVFGASVTLGWILLVLPYFDLGMVAALLATILYLAGAVVNFRAQRYARS